MNIPRTWTIQVHEPTPDQPRWTASVSDPDEEITTYAGDTEAVIGAKVTWHIEKQRRVARVAA